MRKLGYVLLLVSAFLLLGTVGSMEHSGMPLAEGIIRSVAWCDLMFVAMKIIEKYEEKEND